jgi:hypothetical protein
MTATTHDKCTAIGFRIITVTGEVTRRMGSSTTVPNILRAVSFTRYDMTYTQNTP